MRRADARKSFGAFRFPADVAAAGTGACFSRSAGNGMPTGRMDYPSYLILDEYNRFREDEAFDLEAPGPIGAFSGPFLRIIAAMVRDQAQSRRLHAVTRR